MQYFRQLKDNRGTVFVRLVDDNIQCLCISIISYYSYSSQAITAIKHKQRQAKQARETCFSMLITTVCLLLKAYCILTLMLILIAGIRLRFIAILHIPILYHWQQLQIGCIVLERQQEQAKNGTEWSFDADYYCLFIQHLHTLTLVFYRWHTLSLYSSSLYRYHILPLFNYSAYRYHIAIALSFTDYLTAYFP